MASKLYVVLKKMDYIDIFKCQFMSGFGTETVSVFGILDFFLKKVRY